MALDDPIRVGYAALSSGDLDAWLTGFTADAELHELAETPDTAVYRGPEELRRWAVQAMDLAEDWHWEPEEIRETGDGVALVRVRFSARGKGSGIPIEQTVFHVLVFRDGMVASAHGYLDEGRAQEAAAEAPGSGAD